MSKRRMIDTKFWSDNWVRELNPLDRYLFLYLLTNQHTNISGIYELPLDVMAFESGISERDLKGVMLKTLQPKVHYIKGWVYLKNFSKHQSDNESVRKGVQNAISTIPFEIMAQIKAINENNTVSIHPVTSVGTPPGVFESESKLESKDSGEVATEFDFHKELNLLKEGKRKDYKIIALYWKKKDWTFENRAQFVAALKRELRPAKALSGYSGEQIARAIDYCDKEYDVWTLETLHKRITDLINKK